MTPGERSFHIFYQLLAASKRSKLAELKCLKLTEGGFASIAHGGCPLIDGIDDAAAFADCCAALRTITEGVTG